MSANLLVELFTEELPPKALKKIGEAFAREIRQGLIDHRLVTPEEKWQWFATPRRLAIRIQHVAPQQLPKVVTEKLVPVSIAFDADGKPTKALLKKLQSKGFREADIPAFERRVEGKTETLFFQWTDSGFALEQVLGDILVDAFAKLPIPKVMSYQLADGATTVQFVRPAHGLVVLHGSEIVPVSALGLKADRTTHGHRFLGAKDIPVATADAYEEALAAHGRVIASFDERRASIERQLTSLAQQFQSRFSSELPWLSIQEEFNGLPELDALIDEVTALVEYPVVYVGEFESEFLSVPQECLVLTMRTNQKYFPLFDAAGKLTSKFLIVSNMELADPRNIVEGNQRVVGPRLEDARFFYNQDRKHRLEERVPELARVIYHNQLGSQLERVERVQLLAGKIAREIGADPVLAERAAWLAKADLATSMVGEFPELQGIMGRYYALSDGEPPLVATAIEQHYRPRYAGDVLPDNSVAIALALADKLESVVGLFSIGQIPTGDKDPYGLRRATLGCIRILIEKKIHVEWRTLLEAACAICQNRLDFDPMVSLYSFWTERLRNFLTDLDHPIRRVDAALGGNPWRLDLIIDRIEAVKAFEALPEAQSLSAANKRIKNILAKVDYRGILDPHPGVEKEPAEKMLFEALLDLGVTVDKQLAQKQDQQSFTQALVTLATIREPVDRFFDEVLVMAEDEKKRENRIEMLGKLSALMNRVADISLLST